jgi:thioredoxin-dependent peroxiredoxin
MSRTITLKGNPVQLSGVELKKGETCPEFALSGLDLQDFGLSTLGDKTKIICTIPSIDTPVCAEEARKFNKQVATLENVAVLIVSRDLPFAMKRWCGVEEVENVVFGSDYKHRTFGKQFGVDLESLGILTRAVFVVTPEGKISHVEYVAEVGNEPDYDAILAVL